MSIASVSVGRPIATTMVYLIVVTLGLYWPFAQVRLARARLEAVSLQVKGSVNEWLSHAQARDAGALGDAAGDFFGIDMGL